MSADKLSASVSISGPTNRAQRQHISVGRGHQSATAVKHAPKTSLFEVPKSLKIALQAEVDEDAWATLYSDTSRPFPRPSSRRIAVKVINHFGDEVMKVFGV